VSRENTDSKNHAFDLKAGNADLQSWLIASDGLEIPAYFVDVEYID
jgi:hypothetical protein